MTPLIIICILLFADDMVLIAKSRAELQQLLDIVLKYFDDHKLTISTKKTKLMTSTKTSGVISFLGEYSSSPLKVDFVSSFKYLGVTFNSQPYRLFSDFNDLVLRKCETFAHNILSMSKSGPDRSYMALVLWKTVALPSILYSVECIPLHATTISKIECTQNRIGKFVLQVPPSSVNIQVLTDAGLIPVRFLICQKVVQYNKKLRSQPRHNMASICYSQTLSTTTKYNQYFESQLELLPTYPNLPQDIPKAVNFAVHSYAMGVIPTLTTAHALTVPDIPSIGTVKSWVTDSKRSSIYASFRSMNCGLGNRYPTLSGFHSKSCPFCLRNGIDSPNNEIHLLIECNHFEASRKKSIISRLILGMKSVSAPMTNASMYRSILDDTKPYRKEVCDGLLTLFSQWEIDMEST